MPSFVGSPLFIESVTVSGLKAIEVVFAQVPLSVSAYGPTDALNPSNYSLFSNNQTYVAQNVSEAGDRRFQVSFDIPILSGVWVLSASNILTPTSTPLTPDPNLFTFTSTQVAGNVPLGQGANSPNSVEVLKRHISSLFQGKKNWDAAIESLASGDDYVQDLAQKAFKQLFVATASGNYLRQRGSDLGFKFPINIGLSEDDYRQLIIDLSAEKITQQSFQKILEVFYGNEVVRAHMDSSGTLSSLDEKEIVLSIDGETFNFAFTDSMFQYAGNPTAQEVAAILNQEFQRNQLQAFAERVFDSSGNEKVRIYSGKIGLGGKVSCLGGSAQLVFGFPAEIVYTSATIDFTKITNQDKVLIEDAVDDFLFVNAQPGDYIILTGASFEPENRGQFEILEVEVDGNLTKATIRNLYGVNDSSVAVTSANFRIFRPTINTVTSLNPYALVAQASNETDIVMPATSPRVNGNENEASYLLTTDDSGDEQTVFDIGQTHTSVLTIAQDGAGNTTLTFDTAFSVTTGQKVYFGPGWSVEDNWLEEGIYTVASSSSGSITFVGGASEILVATAISDRIISKSFVDNGQLTIATATDLIFGSGETIQLEQAKALTLPSVSFHKYAGTTDTYEYADPTVDTGDSIFWAGGEINGGPPHLDTAYKFDKLTETVTPLASAPDEFASDEMSYHEGDICKVYNSSLTANALIYSTVSDAWIDTGIDPTDLYDSSLTSNRYTLQLDDGSWVGLKGPTNIAINGRDKFLTLASATEFQTNITVDPSDIFELNKDLNGNVLISKSNVLNSKIYRWIDTGDSKLLSLVYDGSVPSAFTDTKWSSLILPLSVPNGVKVIVGGVNHIGAIENKIRLIPIEAPDITPLEVTMDTDLRGASVFAKGNNSIVIIGGFISMTNIPNWEVRTYTFRVNGNNIEVESYEKIENALPDIAFHRFHEIAPYKYFALTFDQRYAVVNLTGTSPFKAKLNQNYTYVSNSGNQKTFDTQEHEFEGTFPVLTTNAKLIKNKALTQYRAGEEITIGPYLLDQKQVGIEFLNVTLTNDVSLVPGIQDIQITGTLDKTAGFLVYGFGFSDQLSFLQIVSRSGNIIKVNYSGPFRKMEAGKSLHYTPSKSIFVPENPELAGLFYVTDSVGMRKYAELLIDQSKAVGSIVNVKLIYPGTIGLGNSNIEIDAPGPKINDAIYIWGDQDEVDDKR
jgi:hypothetical protein